MREGSFLTAVQGRVHQDLRTGWWSFTTDSSGDETREPEGSGDAAPGQPPPGLELILLPNSKLEDIKQVIDATEDADQDLVFEISGRLFVYHGRNFLLATHAPQLIAYRPPAPAPPPATSEADPTNPAGSEGEGPEGDSVEDIMAELARDVGPLHRGALPVDEGSGARDGLIREGTTLLGRRGTLHRDEFGAWIFVFESDSAALKDPPAVVLPCLQLERLESYARGAGFAAPILLSGQVTRYEGRNYVLPTVFRIPRERTLIDPS